MASKRKAEEPLQKVEFTVAVPGAAGSFSACAAQQHFRAHEIDLMGTKSFKEVFAVVEEGKAKYGVLPVESSMSGNLQQTHDCLLQYNLFIVGECLQEEHHCLLAKKGTKKGDLVKVFSHSALHAQCATYMDTLEEQSEHDLERLCVSDSIAGCKKVLAENSLTTGAIGTAKAAELYGLEVLDSSIGNYAPMKTRYVIVSKTQNVLTPQDRLKTSLCVSFGNAPGTFHKVFASFGFRNINIDRVVSRPSTTALEMFTGPSLKHWDYVYYIDYETPCDAKTNERLLATLAEWCLVVRHFGTYPACREITSVEKSLLSTPSLSPVKSALVCPSNTSLYY